MIAYLDCSSGISGDKFLGALIDLGLDPSRIQAACTAVGLDASVVAERVTRSGIAGVSVEILSSDTTWRTYETIRARLEAAALPDPVRASALRAFRLLAQAEARVHGVSPSEVHFHEIGAADTVADLLGVAVGLAALDIERLICSPVALGAGTIEISHGTLPVPAPATSELLQGIPAYGGPVEFELTTPTGAALVAAHASSFGPMPPMTPVRVGRGAGSREIAGLPNVAALTVGDPLALGADATVGSVVTLTTNIDHITPEHAAFACDRLIEAGALDVWQRPVGMKKGRVGIEIEVLCAPADEQRFAALLAAETGTLGIRVARLERWEAARDVEVRDTVWGAVRFKVGPHGIRAEHDDIAAIATREGLAYREVLAALEDAPDCA